MMIMCFTAASCKLLKAAAAIFIDGSKSGISPGVMRLMRPIIF